MTTNHLTADQISSAGLLLGNQGWGYGMGVVTRPTDSGLTPGQYGWSGGYGTTWFNDPSRDLIAIALTQTSDFLWNGGLDEFDRLAVAAVEGSNLPSNGG
jgi:CubicO group peptidase (beta-lactamase class C family)